MSTETNPRVPAGVPTGGQFAASAKGEASVALASIPSPRDNFPRTADGDIDAQAAVREGFIRGFAPHRSETPVTRTMVGHWDGNTIVVEYTDDGEHEDERSDTGQWTEGLWADSATGHSDVEIAAAMLETYDQAHAIRVAQGDWDYTDEDDEDEESCAFEGCDDDLTDNEGYDGYCGHHAEKVEAHEDGEHNDYNGTDSDPDCPEC